ncbi:MAG: site-specific integrase [Bacteroidales bacterium]|jgi:integrase/recombinase XerD|nr:site-specific integrase [Bacteroidales bacterium]
MKQSVTTAIILDKRSKNKDGKYPVKLRVTYNRIPRNFGTKYQLTEDEFEKVSAKKPRGNYKDIKLELSLIEAKAQRIIDNLSDFSFDRFKVNYGVAPKELRNVYYYFNKKVEELEKSGRIGSANFYNSSSKSLKDFFKKPSYLEFKEITPKKLEQYEEWMVYKDNSVTTVGMYLRALRAIINEAIREGIIAQEYYPFGKGKYQIPISKNIKKALTIDKIAKLYNYEIPEFSYADKARDLWFFSYLCNGANMADIARLKYKNVSKETISFIRNKTAKSRKEGKPIVAPLTDDLNRIIKKWGNNDKSPENYVFPAMEEGLTPKQEKAKIKWLIKQTNKYMQKIAPSVGIDEKITTYTARHSFSTVLKRSGASIEFISESLGHSDLKTTENYLDSFENDVKKEYAAKLTAFKI